MRPLNLHADHLPDSAVPFVRELILEIARRIPTNLGSPPRFQKDDLADPLHCANAAQGLVCWFDTVPETVGQRVEELEGVFATLLATVQGLDTKIRRAVLQTRGRAEEQLAFRQTSREILAGVRDSLVRCAAQPEATAMLTETLKRLDGGGLLGAPSPLEVSTQFDGIQHDLDQLRAEISRVEHRARELREQSLRDPLTGLWNRRALDGRLEEEICRGLRYKSPLSVLVWDLDHFKRVNDTHGHPAGDMVLQSMAGRVLSMLRRSDFMARIGGEEFVVILTNTAILQACQAAEKIRRSIAADPVSVPSGQVSITASIGLAALEPGDKPATLLGRADQALHQAKTTGRNRVALPCEPADQRAENQ